ncbi:rRNA maturation RNase YbeY [Patescibacteria group bacterium]|nr:rRNA maturation RNase YbeY [Patescibacteria group bacterium]MBP9710071.1 rRNA maturation RNase YbeY [Patescibacteria group bacterium]
MLSFEVVSSLPSSLTSSDLDRLAEVVFKAVKMPKLSTVSLTFVSESRMQEINQAQRGKDRPTDVLSFATAEEMRLSTPTSSPTDLGDIFMCPVYARREAKRRGIDDREELLRLLVHGILHLQGYDHVTLEEESEMFGLQERLLERILKRTSRAASKNA